MPNLTVAVIGPPGYSKELGKKGTATDITLYDLKRGEDTVSFIEPTGYPERLAPLFLSCSLADCALLVVEEVNALFGECVLLLDALRVLNGRIVLRNYVSKERVVAMTRGTVVEGYEYMDEDFANLRESYLGQAASRPPGNGQGEGSIAIDHHFHVKGVGTVALGHVIRGSVHRHDELRVLPGKVSAQVRSIQKHDDDFESAHHGDRVGVALKGVDADVLDRGFVLTNQPDMVSQGRMTAVAQLVRYWPSPLREGMVVHVGHWMQFLPARIAKVESSGDWRSPRLELAFEKELVHAPGASRAVLCYLDGGKLRVAGRLELT